MKICVSIIGPSMEEALKDLRRAGEVADVVEFRIDKIKDFDLEKLIDRSEKPVLITNRSKAEGGDWEGSEADRIVSLRQAVKLGADYVDLEASSYTRLSDTPHRTKIIGSYHNFKRTPFDLDAVYRNIAGVDDISVVKIAVMAEKHSDAIEMLRQINTVQIVNGKPIIGISMGKFGKITRIYGPILGGYMTLCSLDESKSAAPGQIPAVVLRKVWKDLGYSENDC